MRIDLNCDMGESFGAYKMGNDEPILDFVTSANIACGYHAGDPATIRATVSTAQAKGVAIGAHPGLPDLQGFGRRPMAITPRQAYDMVLYQIGAVAAFARAAGARLRHVKAHGALYNMASRDEPLAEAIASAVRDFDRDLVLFGLAGSAQVRAGERLGLPVASEVFADRTYQDDGSLTPRTQQNAMIEDANQSIAQVIRMVREGVVRSTSGRDVPVRADTLCIHGDQPNALVFAQRIREAFAEAGIEVRGLATA